MNFSKYHFTGLISSLHARQVHLPTCDTCNVCTTSYSHTGITECTICSSIMYLNSKMNCMTNQGEKNHTHKNKSSFLSKESPAIIPLYPWQLSPVNAHVSV